LQLVQRIVRTIPVDFPLKDAMFRFDPAYWHGCRSRLGSITDTEIAKRAMTKAVPDVAIAGADHRRSALMAAAQAGDSAAYQTLLRDCIPVIQSVARRRRVDGDRIDDVVQDVLLTVHRARHTYDPSRSFTAWLCVIADRRAIDLLRRTRRQDMREVYAPLAFESHADDEAADPSRGLAHADATGTVARALASLPARQREAVQHFVIEERSLADTSALTRRTKGSLKVNLHRALKALRSKMEFRE
jgi:RNA polymerase sigma-70 factor (ECF subfamily)